MSNLNPLQKYFRQPKIFIKLPSNGLYYEPGTLQGDYNNVPIFAMTGMDEIIYKTPDALYSGEATQKVIESCCPYITDASKVPSTDIDALVVAIRIATFGDKITLDKDCSHCQAENTYEVPLSTILDHYNGLTFNNTVIINDELTLKIRPLKYFEMNHYSVENFKLQKTLSQVDDAEPEVQQQYLNEIYKDLADLQLDLCLTSTEQVLIPGAVITDKQQIGEWLENADRTIFSAVKDKLDENRAAWSIPAHTVVCSSCQQENKLNLILDQSNFFV